MPDAVHRLVGGSFAPPLSDKKLAAYKALADALPASPVKDAMLALHRCCCVWWDLPEPQGTAQWAHPAGKGTIVALQKDHVNALWDHIPWEHELVAMGELFETIPNDTQKPLRDAAHHLLWHVRELNLDREPLTSDKL